jgi:hypothetical protein
MLLTLLTLQRCWDLKQTTAQKEGVLIYSTLNAITTYGAPRPAACEEL